MSMSAWKRTGVALTAAVVVTGVAGCQGDDAKKAAEAPAKAAAQGVEEMTQALTAAFRKTSDAKSAKVTMTMSMEGVGAQSGTMTMSGVQSWDPAAMDITMKGSMLAAGNPEAPEQVRMVMLDGAMYMDLGAEAAAKTDGKRWMKIDMKAAAAASGDKALQKQMTGGLEDMNQDPAQQLALLLESPSLKHVGAEKVNGMETEHYKGTLSIEQMLDANKSKLLSKQQRDSLAATVEKAGFKGYETEVWVTEEGYPARMDIGMTMAQGTVHMRADYSDYGAKATVQAPPAAETFDLLKMLQDAGKSVEG